MPDKEETVKADLRVFGAIGLQDFWLVKHNFISPKKRYASPTSFFQNLIHACIARDISICALTTEDDRVYPRLPEDRFGYLKESIPKIRRLKIEVDESLGNDVLKFTHDGKQVYIINSQTVHPYEGLQDKLQVVGTNRIKNGLTLQDTIKHCEDNDLIYFQVNSRRKIDQPGFSSAHFLSEVGTSCIEFPKWMIDTSSQSTLLDTLSRAIRIAKPITNKSIIKDLASKVMLQVWGRNPNRFRGCKSSYNLPQSDVFYNYS